MDKQVFVDGQFVSERVSQVVQAIRDYSPEIEVQWIPPSERNEGQAAFRIMHFPPGREPYIIMHVKTEEEFDARVLKRIIQGDQRNGKVTVGEIEAAEEAAKRVAHQKFLDGIEEANEIAAFALKSPLNTIKINKDLVIKDGVPFNAKGL